MDDGRESGANSKRAEIQWRGKKWQRFTGQRSRALAIAESQGHEVRISLQDWYKNKQGEQRGYLSTSFATYADYDAWMAALPPSSHFIYELWVRII